MTAALARHADPDTSRQAAARAGSVEDLIVDVFVDGVRLTDSELCARLDDHYGPTVKSARSRLTARGVLADTGQRRPSPRGRPQIVWERAEPAGGQLTLWHTPNTPENATEGRKRGSER